MHAHRARPHGRVLVALLAAGSLLAAACGDDDTSATADDTSTTASEMEGSDHSHDEGIEVDPASAPTIEAPTTIGSGPATTAPAGEVIDVEVADGEVTGGGRHSVPVGETVTVRVTSDVADEVHLHGYDVSVEVGAGKTVDLTFEASVAGVFEVELEDAGLLLLELEVS